MSPFSAMRRTFAVLAIAVLAGCGGEGDGSDGSFDSGPSFISWNGSANGSLVLAAAGVQVQFLSNNGHLWHNGTEWSNVVLDRSNATVSFNGGAYGVVALVAGTNNTKVAALLCNNGYFASVGATTMGCSTTRPSF
jgi:hypothetical protein